MAQQQLQTQIILSGRIDSSFGPLAAALDGLANRTIAMASGINQVSQPILKIGKDVTKLYAGFDDAMRYIQAVSNLTEQQLIDVEKAARNAGKTTRYSATSSAEALAYGAEAGLVYKDNIELLPDVLNMAAAGNMELETAMDQLLTMLYSTGTPLSEAGDLVDALAMAASSSKTDIESMGEAVTRLGGISRYAKGGTSELLAMLAMMAQRGQEGSEAGTYLRNVILALVAPTKSAADVMKELNASEEELDEALDGINVANAAKQMKKMGLQVYDTATGELRPMIDILWDLKAATDAMSDKERNEALGNLFPKRTLAAVTNLMGELTTSYDRIAKAIDNAEGAAKRMADTRESGIGGALRLLSNAADELKLAFGEELSNRITLWAGSLRDFALTISEMPVETKNFLIDIASAIAFMGPAAMFAGLALKGLASIIAFIGTPFGAVVTGVVALGLLSTHMENMARAERYNAINRNFGTLEVSADALKKAVSNLDGGMGTALANLDTYGKASEEAGTKYSTLLQTLSGDIQSAVIFGQTISPEKAAELYKLGEEMVSVTQSGIRSKQMQVTGFVKLLFADDPEDVGKLSGMLNGYFDGLYTESFNIGAEMRSRMTEALRDGELDADEWAAIQKSIERLNEINAKIQSIKNSAEVEAIYQRGMRLGFDAFNTTMDEFTVQRKKVVDDANATLDDTIGFIIAAEAAADKEGKGQFTDKELEEFIKETRKRSQGLILANNQETSAAMVRLMEGIFKDYFSSLWGYGDALESEIARIQKENPGMGYTDALIEAKKNGNLPQISDSDMLAFNEWWSQVNSVIAGMDVEDARAYYTGKGEPLPEWITALDDMYARGSGLLGSNTSAARYNEMSAWEKAMVYSGGAAVFMPTWAESQQASYLKGNYEAGADDRALRDAWAKAYQDQVDDLMPTRDASFWTGWGEYYEKNKDREFDIPSFIKTQYDIDSYIADMILDEYVNQVDAAKPSSSLIHDVYGDLVAQAGSLGVEAGSAFNTGFQGSMRLSGGLQGAIAGIGIPRYAEGGRAVEAAIFGEAGPEWAIPESHTQRTAELLNRARLASGFSWPELIASTGGLGGGGNTYHYGGPVYAPVIYAKDARGVEDVLSADKKRFDDWWEDKKRETERGSWS